MLSNKKDAAEAKGFSAAGTHKAMKKTASIMMPVMKQRKKNTETDPLVFNPPDNAYTPYFKELEGKKAPNFIADKDLVLCKGYASVS